MRRLASSLALIAIASATVSARANGRFPAAEQVVIQPGAPNHLVVRTTFGILTSTDDGHAFDWICEAAANYGSGLDPGITVSGDGTIVVGIFGGVSAGHGDACTFDVALPGTFITDVTIDKEAPSVVYAIGSKASGYFLWRSTDNARTWTEQSMLPNGFIPATVDVAPSDSMRLYASGGLFADGGSNPTLLRSIDGGVSWDVAAIPTSAGVATPYIAGIAPNDPLTVWVRPDVEPGVLFVTRDAGDHWDTALTLTKGGLEAFALSPDGSTTLAGGPLDGIYMAKNGDAGSPSFARISRLPATCVAWPDSRIFACTDDSQVDYALAESDDNGMTFAPILPIACVRGPLDCKKGSGVAKTCGATWPMVATQIKHDTCDDAGAPTTASSAASASGAGGGAASSGGNGGGNGVSTHGSGGCNCHTSPGSSEGGFFLTFVVGTMSLYRRNRRRPRAY